MKKVIGILIMILLCGKSGFCEVIKNDDGSITVKETETQEVVKETFDSGEVDSEIKAIEYNLDHILDHVKVYTKNLEDRLAYLKSIKEEVNAKTDS